MVAVAAITKHWQHYEQEGDFTDNNMYICIRLQVAGRIIVLCFLPTSPYF